MQPDRSGLVQLTTDPKLDSAPMLSPDGTRVAFERTDPDAGNADIWIVNADGTNEIPITQTDQVEDWPSWSPDGTRLLFTRTSLQDTVETAEIAIRTVAPAARLEPPESDTVVFQQESLPGAATVLVPTWSPDGSSIAFISDKDGARQLYTIHADGSNLKKLTTAGATSRPAWSPDSSTIGCTGRRIGAVWLPADEHLGDGEPSAPAWRPSLHGRPGGLVARRHGGRLGGRRRNGSPIWAVNVDATNLRRLTGDDRYGDLSWGSVATR